jgi:hypothetical protein
MGLYQSIYVGPFLKVKRKFEDKSVIKRFCPTHSKKQVTEDTNFCPLCGAKIESITKTQKSEISLKDIFEEKNFTDSFYIVEKFDNEDHILEPNQWVNNTIRIEDKESGCYSIEENNISTSINSFKEVYKKEIFFLEKSQFEFEILFGLVVSYN